MRRVPPSERTKEMIGELLREGSGEESPRAALSRLAIRRVVEEALEGAVRDIVGREYYGRRQGEAQGYRNGYREGRLKTSEGEVRYASPQVREVKEASTCVAGPRHSKSWCWRCTLGAVRRATSRICFEVRTARASSPAQRSAR